MSTEVKTSLVKQFENNTDFTVCVFKCVKQIDAIEDAFHYTVTVYDIVSKEHEAIKSFRHLENALTFAKNLNAKY